MTVMIIVCPIILTCCTIYLPFFGVQTNAVYIQINKLILLDKIRECPKNLTPIQRD